MVTLFICWIVFPAVMAILSLGSGLLVERASRTTLPVELLLPTGFAAIVTVTLFSTLSAAIAPLTLPLVLAASVVGLAASLPPRLRRFDPWAVAAAVGVFAVFAAPVLLAGDATFAGYVKLDDTATFLALTDRALEHGRSLEGLAPSSYEATLASTSRSTRSAPSYRSGSARRSSARTPRGSFSPTSPSWRRSSASRSTGSQA